MLRLLFAVLAMSVALTGCDAYDYLTGNKEKKLAGERLPVILQNPPAVDTAERRPIVLPIPDRNKSWPQAAGNAAHALHHLALLNKTPTQVWSKGIGRGASDSRTLLARPITGGGRIYTMDSAFTITASDAWKGDTIWQTTLTIPRHDNASFAGGLAFDHVRRSIYVTTGFARIFSLDAATGKELWTADLAGPGSAAPTVGDSKVVAITIDNQTQAFNAATGTLRWSHRGVAEPVKLLGDGSAAMIGDTTIVPYSSGEIYAFSTNNGQTLWTNNLATIRQTDQLSTIAQIRGHPVATQDVVFATSHSGRTGAVDLRSGNILWDRSIGSSETPWIAGDLLFLISTEAEVYCLHRRNGQVLWVSPLPRYEDPEDKEDPIQWLGPVLAGNRLYIAGRHGTLLALSPTDGEILETLASSMPAAVPPIVSDGTLYLLTKDANLAAFR